MARRRRGSIVDFDFGGAVEIVDAFGHPRHRRRRCSRCSGGGLMRRGALRCRLCSLCFS
jgi:hypothetical protein